jgi:hypothetical protein
MTATLGKQAQLDEMRMGRKDRKIHATNIDRRPHGKGSANCLMHAGRTSVQARALHDHPVISAYSWA